MTDHQLLVLVVIAVGFVATVAAVIVLAYLLLADLLSRASGSLPNRPHTPMPDVLPPVGDSPVRALGDSLAGGSREVAAAELPHQLWSGGGIV